MSGGGDTRGVGEIVELQQAHEQPRMLGRGWESQESVGGVGEARMRVRTATYSNTHQHTATRSNTQQHIGEGGEERMRRLLGLTHS